MNSESHNKGFQSGYQYFLKNWPATNSAIQTADTSGLYLKDIEDKIQQLTEDINIHGNDNPANNGYLAEYWHADTYNIMAAVKRSASHATPEDSPNARMELGGADITTDWGEKIGSKYYSTAKGSAMAQAITIKKRYMEYKSKNPNCTVEEYLKLKGLDENTDINLPLYEGQARLIPADQLHDAIEALQKRIDHDLYASPEQAKDVQALRETMNALTDHIEGPNGEKSLPLTEAQSKALQQCAKNKNFDPQRFDISTAKLADRSFLIQNSLKAGATAAWTSVLLQLIPSIVKLLSKAIKDNEITEEDITNISKTGINAASSGFVRGFLVSAITTSAEMGYFGKALQKMSFQPEFSSAIAVIVVTTITIASASIKLAKKEITKEEFAYISDKTIFIAASGYICGVAVQSLLPEVPSLGYMLGSLLGSLLGGVLFEAKEHLFISLCVKNGWTCFGIVKQDYTLPDNVVKQLGIHQLEISTLPISTLPISTLPVSTLPISTLKLHQFELVYLKRGVIGIRKIGYV